MLTYNFKISKKACFAYWAQSLIEWDDNFNASECKYFLRISGDLSASEQNHLKVLKHLLQRKDAKLFFLWDRYLEKSIIDGEHHKVWQQICAALESHFEIVWQTELPRLKAWQSLSQFYPFSKFSKLLDCAAHFFNVEIELLKEINVILLPHYNTISAAGSTLQKYPNVVLLKVSNLPLERRENAATVLLHESVHLIEFRSLIASRCMKASYLKILKPIALPPYKQIMRRFLIKIANVAVALGILKYEMALKLRGFPWHYLFRETVVTSIAGPYSKTPSLDRKKQKNMFIHHILSTADVLRETTNTYLTEEKIIDQPYCDKLAKTWLAIVRK